MQAFISLIRSNSHEIELRKRDEEINKLKELVKKKQELDKRNKEIENLKKSLQEVQEESDVVTDIEQSDSESEVDSGSEYHPSEEENESEYEEEAQSSNSRRGRQQHCSYCDELGHKTTSCYERSWDILVRSRLNEDALRDFVAQL